jgi:hypothetical protein
MTRDPIANLADVIDAVNAINAAVARMSTQSGFVPAVRAMYDASMISDLRDILAAPAASVARFPLNTRLKDNTDPCHCNGTNISFAKPYLN